MAYIGQDKKKEIAALLKPVLKQYGVKGSLSIDHYSTLVFTIASGQIDFLEDYTSPPHDSYITVNPYWYHEHFSGKALRFLKDIFPILNKGNHDNSRAEIDYFDVGWYVNVKIGRWNKPYVLES